MGSRPTIENVWTKPALFLLDEAEIDSVGLERVWDAIRDEMRRIEYERANPTACPERDCTKLEGHPGLHQDADGWNFV